MANRKRFYRRPRRKSPGRGGDGISKGGYEKPRLDPRLKPIFRKIGVPEPLPFIPDPFQLEALEGLKESDVLVSAPTGAGKTWIASQAIWEYLGNGLRTWYASPLKALSNSIYQDFRQEFGFHNCGILTGDRKENPGASIIVGTTEILRNQLYDAMHEGKSIEANLVVLDEAHYLSDPDRGVVWEEVLIYLPSRVRILLLSATISNAEEIASWLEEIRGIQTSVVRSKERPVPLEMLFLFPDGLISPLAGKRGLAGRVKKFMASENRGRERRRSGKLNFGEIIKCLRQFDLLPAIFFLKSRTDCDRALLSCPPVKKSHDVEDSFRRQVKAFAKEYPHLRGHRQTSYLLESKVGAHHAGQLPYWKVLIERMMNMGHLEAIFSTSTVAAGVNFPARTVVLVQSDRYDGHEFTNLTSTELHQMSGRAGRRGKDNIGFALLIPGLHQDPQLIYQLRDSSPEPLMSQVYINFSMTLNLLLSHRPREVKDLLDRSFVSFQGRKSSSAVPRRWETLLEDLNRVIPRGKCDIGDPYEILENIQKNFEMVKEERRSIRQIQYGRLLSAYREYLRPGRLFMHKNRRTYVVFHTYMDHGRFMCAAHDIEKTVRTRKRKIRLRKVPLEKIRGIYDYRVSLPDGSSIETLQALFDGINMEQMEILNVEIPQGRETIEELGPSEMPAEENPCDGCEHLRDCYALTNRELRRILEDFRSLAKEMEPVGRALWLSFKRHLRFLKETRFVDEMDRLTPDGYWASKLRLDHPLLIAEAIRKGAFGETSPEVLAGCIAPFVWDRIQEVELQGESPLDLQECDEALRRILGSLTGIRKLMARRGFENPSILFWPAAALFLWAKGVGWERLLWFVPVDEGDMASLIVRTADHLRQVTNLMETHPGLASAARMGIELILREPVFLE